MGDPGKQCCYDVIDVVTSLAHCTCCTLAIHHFACADVIAAGSALTLFIPAALLCAPTTQVDSHLESHKKADLRVNLQIGTGGDKYLGVNDIYVTESDIFGLPMNEQGGDYWTFNKIPFTAKQTALLKPGMYTFFFQYKHLSDLQLAKRWL
jgi:hypothetical protein